jgi:hypothetical protein
VENMIILKRFLRKCDCVDDSYIKAQKLVAGVYTHGNGFEDITKGVRIK